MGEFGENSLAPVQVIDQSSNESESIEQWGYIDRSGKILIQPQFQWASGFNEGLAVVRIAEVGAVAGAKGSGPTTRAPSKKKAITLDQYGLIDTTGQFAFPGRFNHALSFSEGLAAVDVDGKWGFIDKTGKFVLSPMFAMAGSFKDGLAPVRTDKKSNVGYIDKTGHFVIAPQFDEGNEFSEGRAAVRIGAPPQKGEWEFLYLRKRSGLSATKGNKVGFVDKSGSLVINPQFTFASVFQHGVAQVEWADGIDGWIDSTGAAIYDPRSQMSPPGSDKSANSKNANAPTRIAGSAFFVSEEGHMLTNYHIGGDCKDILIPSLSGSAQFLHGDSINDLALLRSNKKPVGTVAVFRRSDDIEQGEHVILYGYPLSGVLASDGNISSGQISALVGLANNVSQIQISAPVQPGNSGGPLIDGKGRIIGVVVSKLSAVKVAAVTGDIPQNVNFAINLRTTKAFLDSQKIKYETSSIFARDKSDEDIAARAREFTFAVECIK